MDRKLFQDDDNDDDFIDFPYDDDDFCHECWNLWEDCDCDDGHLTRDQPIGWMDSDDPYDYDADDIGHDEEDRVRTT